MAISILFRQPSQRIPRPFNRASSKDEMIELLRRYGLADVNNLDTDRPVVSGICMGLETEFYAFTEL